MTELILILGLVAGIYMAWNIGANDVANAMASAVGAKAITLRQAVIIGGVLDFLGASLIGSQVTSTIRKSIIDANVITDPKVMMLGLLASLLAAAFWVFFSTWSQFPVSTTHSIVGAMLGFGIVAGGPGAIQWGKIVTIVISWLVSPIFAGLLGYLIFQLIRRKILQKTESFVTALRWTPLFAGTTIFIVLISLITKTPLGEKLGIGAVTGLIVSGVSAIIFGLLSMRWMARTIHVVEEAGVEVIFKRLQIFTSCYVALAHGANDVANAVGPVAGIYIIFTMGSLEQAAPVPWFLLMFGGFFIMLGVLTWGYKVIETVGSKITVLTNTRGFAVDFGTATSVLIASKIGLPVSTTHAAVGAVVGVGLAGGLAAVDLRVIWKIVLYWVITLPLSALPAMLLYKILAWIFL